MSFARDPNDRRRVDAETQHNRDAEIARLRRQDVPFRVIASTLGVSLGAVQKSLIRSRKLAAALAGGSPGDVVAVVADNELVCEDVKTPEDVERLSELEYFRLLHLPADSPPRRALTEWEPSPEWRAAHPPRPPGDGRVSDGPSWRAGVDRALSDDSGVDAAADW